MHERMEFPWEVEEQKPGLAYIGMPDGTELVDPECEAVQALPNLINALKDINTLLSNHPDADRGNSKVHYALHQARSALKKAGVEC